MEPIVKDFNTIEIDMRLNRDLPAGFEEKIDKFITEIYSLNNDLTLTQDQLEQEGKQRPKIGVICSKSDLMGNELESM